MKIAQVAPLTESVPPKTYGGTERVVYHLTEELCRQRHDVTLFASGDSLTSARHMAVIDQSLRKSSQPRDAVIWHQKQLMKVASLADEFDLIHFHTDFSHFSLMRFIETPFVTTLHGRLNLPDLEVLFDEFWDANVVSISDSQRKPLPRANWVGTVYNGTPAESFTFREQPGEYFAFVGRFSPEKGPLRAIEIAKRLNTPLKMAAKIDVVDRDYFDTHIKPELSHPLIEYIGEVDERGKNELLGNAKATLFPIDWPEPFGLVMTESMACGTPVVAFRNGSVDEVMSDGVSGFIVDTLPAAIEAAAAIETIDRRACRDYFLSRFSVQRMTAGYLQVYRKLVAAEHPSESSVSTAVVPLKVAHPEAAPAATASRISASPHSVAALNLGICNHNHGAGAGKSIKVF